MNRVEIRVDKTDRDRLQTLGCERPEQLARFVAVELLLDRAIAQNTFAKFQPKPPWYQRDTAYPIGILYVRPPLAPHLEVVAETTSSNQNGRCRLTFDYGIGGDGRSVDETLDAS